MNPFLGTGKGGLKVNTKCLSTQKEMNLGGVIALKIGIRNRMIELECYIASQFLYEL